MEKAFENGEVTVAGLAGEMERLAARVGELDQRLALIESAPGALSKFDSMFHARILKNLIVSSKRRRLNRLKMVCGAGWGNMQSFLGWPRPASCWWWP